MPGRGIDIGTMNIVAAKQAGKGKVETSRVRDAFLDLEAGAKKMLKLSGVNFIDRGEDGIIVVGDAALDMANVFGREARRPLQAGLISAGEMDALEILGIMIKNLLGPPEKPGEHCFFSVPAAPVDEERDVVYHQGVFDRIVTECGYTATPSNEAMAIIYAETAKDGFSGLGISFGCLTPDTRVYVRGGYIPVSEVAVGDEVLTRTGEYSRVLQAWNRPHEGEVYKIGFDGNPFGVTLTGNHRVWARRGSGHRGSDGDWEWIRAENLSEGDIIGEPTVAGIGRRTSLSLTEKDRNGPTTKRTIDWSMKMGRFLGYFLADGHLGPDDRYTIWFDFGPEEQQYVDDLTGITDGILHRAVSVTKHGNALRCQLSHKSLHGWLRKHCYDEDGVKRFPLNIEDIRQGLAEGILVGLIRGDGWAGDMLHFGNSSESLITACHLLFGRLGLTSTVTHREPRDTTFQDGRTIKAEDCKPEWAVHLSGLDGVFFRNLIEDCLHDRRAPRVWREGGFRCTRIRKIEVIDYDGDVHDLTIEGDPSFCAPFITMHNSGMCNTALAINGIEGLTFSVARGGDWIDGGAAKATGSTSSRMCAVKEKGIDLLAPKTREEEALALYYKALVVYCIDHTAAEFAKIADRFALPKAIPIVVSGGTALAGNFLPFFEQVFETKRKRFPIEVSEIRQASDPLNAVARGLLIQALQEDED